MVETHWKMLEEARALRSSGQNKQALMVYRQLLLIHPEAAEAWADYGSLLLSVDQVEGAQEAFSRALDCDPDCLPALASLGQISLRLGRYEESVATFSRLLSLDPRRINVRMDLAWCHVQRGDLTRAWETLLPGVDQEPSNADVTTMLTHIFIRQGNWVELHREMLRRVNLDYSGASAELERSYVNLNFGAMSAGWEQYESRLSFPGKWGVKREFTQPLWNGEPLEGRTLLLHWEQGFGDTLMFVRYAPLTKQRGGKILLLAQPELADLVATCTGVDEVIVEGHPLPCFDLQLPLLSLPRVFKTDLDSIPADIPYLSVPKRVPHREGIDRILAATEGLTRVGLAWTGSPRHAKNAERSIPAALLKPLEALPGVVWHSFQTELMGEPPFPRIIPFGPIIRGSFSDTAYALIGMDLVITVDTALAHLAGALGVPTLLLINAIPDWRWLMGREDSPWYPSIRLYRQPETGDWEPVIQRVLADLGNDQNGL